MGFVWGLSSNAWAITKSQPAYHADNNFNVWMKIEGTAKGESFSGLCNGSLIEKDLIITSAHCLSGSTQNEAGVTVQFGEYRTLTGKNTFSLFYPEVDVIKSKKIHFLKSIDQKARQGKYVGPGAVGAYLDMALIELERPVDQTKIRVTPVKYVSAQEHATILSQPHKYFYVVLSTNLVTTMSTDYRRYVEMTGINFKNVINRAYTIPMYNSLSPSAVEEGDSGAPVLVNIDNQWKLFALVKGQKRDLLSATIEDLIKKPIHITPAINIYTPVGTQMCELMAQAGRHCIY